MSWLPGRLLLLGRHEWQFVAQKGKNYVVGLAVTLTFLLGVLTLADMYWPAFISQYAHNMRLVYVGMTITFVWSVHLLNLLVYDIIDWWNLLPQYKIIRHNLPWDNREQWRPQLLRAIFFNVINIGLLSPLSLWVESSYGIGMNMLGSIPTLPEVLWQLLFCMTLENLLFYVVHRAAHNNPWLYRLHKVHHEIAVPCPLATNVFHPLDYLIGIAIPFVAGPKILGSRMHYITFLLWYLPIKRRTLWRISDGYDGHCNYQIPWHPLRVFPFVANAQYHSYHHTHNVGNYGSDLYDTLGASNVEYFKYKVLQDEELWSAKKGD